MGGGYYDHDVAYQTRSTNTDAFSYQGVSTAEPSSRRSVHPILNPYNAIRECQNHTPIVVAMDVTRSRGNDSRIMYEKLPMFVGQIEMKGYVEGPAVSFAAIGDASSGDQAPIQVGQFEADNRLDEVLSSFWLEEGGGGTGQESYELMAYFYARHSKLRATEEGRKGYFFFVGDEGFYPTIRKDQVRAWLGRDEATDLDSKQVFEELQKLYHVFFIYPKKSFEERKQDIDAEIKQRVEQAGGTYQGVDVRLSLIWDNTNDLDLHVIPPSGEHLFYGHKQSACKGWLDVDMNVRGESLKPVENVRWKKGEAPKGHYRAYVQNFRFHDPTHAPTHYRVELEVNGQISHVDGVISKAGETGAASDQWVADFTFDPSQRPAQKAETDSYAGYQDAVILAQWESVLPPERILRIDDAHSIVDVMLGALALVGGTRDLEGYRSDLREREQGESRESDTLSALGELAGAMGAKTMTAGSLPKKLRSNKNETKLTP